MNEGNRVKEIRKSLSLTSEAFGKRLGVGRTAISNIENGNRGVTEQMKKAICREYNVDYIWLTTGEGDMFIDSDDNLLEIIDRILVGENELHKRMLSFVANMNQQELDALELLIDSLLAENKKTDS